MATKPVGKAGVEEEAPAVHRIRITLTSKNVKNLEKGASQQAQPNVVDSRPCHMHAAARPMHGCSSCSSHVVSLVRVRSVR